MNWTAHLSRMSVLVALLWFGATGMVLAEARLALVIGNSTYKVGALANPRNDAALMAETLEAEIQSTTGPFTPQEMIVVDDRLLVTTHKGQGENGSIYAFTGWRAAVAGQK